MIKNLNLENIKLFFEKILNNKSSKIKISSKDKINLLEQLSSLLQS